MRKTNGVAKGAAGVAGLWARAARRAGELGADASVFLEKLESGSGEFWWRNYFGAGVSFFETNIQPRNFSRSKTLVRRGDFLEGEC